jgi:hypothetical protein
MLGYPSWEGTRGLGAKSMRRASRHDILSHLPPTTLDHIHRKQLRLGYQKAAAAIQILCR